MRQAKFVADDIQIFFFYYFSEKTSLHISIVKTCFLWEKKKM